MGTVRSVRGLEYLSNVTLEEAKTKMLEKLDTVYGNNDAAENYFSAPFTVQEARYVYAPLSNPTKCASDETVLVFRDSTGIEYRRFIFRP